MSGKYNFENAYKEAYEIKDKALELKSKRNKEGEPSKDDYLESEQSLRADQESKQKEDDQKLEKVRQKIQEHSSGDKETNEKNQLEKINLAEELIVENGGEIDHDTKAYKDFDASRYERFLIQKGKYLGRDVVFKITDKNQEKVIEQESARIQEIAKAKIKEGERLDVKMILQIGEGVNNDNMIGLATEYFNDDQELKKTLTSEQKVRIVSDTIENLQKIEVPKEASLDISDADKIQARIKDLSNKLAHEGFIGQEISDKLIDILDKYGKNLEDEELVFCHGDVQGGNIFLNKDGSGNFNVALSDFEGLKISNKYHDWCEFLNKAKLFKYIAENNPEFYEQMRKDIENIWGNPEVQFSEEEIISKIIGGDSKKEKNFRLTRIYDLLMRMSNDVKNDNQFSKERRKSYLLILEDEIEKLEK